MAKSFGRSQFRFIFSNQFFLFCLNVMPDLREFVGPGRRIVYVLNANCIISEFSPGQCFFQAYGIVNFADDILVEVKFFTGEQLSKQVYPFSHIFDLFKFCQRKPGNAKAL
ncbi:hypothetical protein AXF13_08335 [Desulfovibrio fairfieldensis]|uniref:Uncharacterized protein n=1 Tax=Desulfovibrio fairfieldensis TaxID=44742 RepID=A0A0X8JJV7_9BACT|nr:hypothetical protein AXF13_08335 [Desulfovibrio fairfieldensis]